jgi:hypothetical protein
METNEFIERRKVVAVAKAPTAEFKQSGSGISPNNIQEFLESATNAADKGSSQFLTPEPFAAIIARPLSILRPVIADLNCGSGSLLNGVTKFIPTEKNKSPSEEARYGNTTSHLGIDIDNRRGKHPDQVSMHKIGGDLTLVYPLLQEVGWKADLIVLNPPWGLHWHKDRLEALRESKLQPLRDCYEVNDPVAGNGQIDSTIATLMIALDCLTTRGEGVLIANEATLNRLIFADKAPYKFLSWFFWARLSIKGNPMTGIDDHAWTDDSSFRTAVIYFAHGHGSGLSQANVIKVDDMSKLEDAVHRISHGYRSGPAIHSSTHLCQTTVDIFNGVRVEWEVRQQKRKPKHNIWLNSMGEIVTYLSLFEEHSAKVNKEHVKRLFELRGKKPIQLVMQSASRQELQWAVKGGVWKVDPELPKQVDAAVAAYHAVRAPLYPLSPIQRLGYLDEEKYITCRKDLFLHADNELAPHGVSMAERFLKCPNRGTWDELSNCIIKGGKTAWQLVMTLEPGFQKTCPGVEPGMNLDLSKKWKTIPKLATIREILLQKAAYVAGSIYEAQDKGGARGATEVQAEPRLGRRGVPHERHGVGHLDDR